jgi:hypothetical protein
MRRQASPAVRLLLPSALSLVVLAAGCGGSHVAGVARLAATTTPSANDSSKSIRYRTPPTKADLYAASACMRKHGVPNFPNPIFILGNYRFGYTVDSGVNPDTPQFQKAHRYCTKRYLDTGKPFSPAQLARWHTQALKYAECIRAHGLKIFPDPPPASQNGLGSPEILLPATLPQNLLGTPAWLHAQRACKSLSAGIAVAWSG